jgi:hypothetical protein
MSDFRNSNYDYRNPDDPFRADANLDPNARAPSAAWGWVAAAVFLVLVLAVAFGFGHRPGELGTNTASNNISPPAVTHMSPPATLLPPSTTPGTPTPPAAAPTAPAAPGATH